VVFEAIPSPLTEVIMPRMRIPVIGIGAGGATDGQVLVFHDLLGMYAGHKARFVKRYANVREQMIEGVTAFANDVRARRYPEPEHGYTMAPDELERLHVLIGEGTGEPFTGGFSL
jgi:3-methyl-2-oxobutanoate hydroxymethyltransferase